MCLKRTAAHSEIRHDIGADTKAGSVAAEISAGWRNVWEHWAEKPHCIYIYCASLPTSAACGQQLASVLLNKTKDKSHLLVFSWQVTRDDSFLRNDFTSSWYFCQYMCMQILEKLEKPQSAELNLLTSISSLCHKVKKKKKRISMWETEGKKEECSVMSAGGYFIWQSALGSLAFWKNTQANGVKVQPGLASSNMTLNLKQIRRLLSLLLQDSLSHEKNPTKPTISHGQRISPNLYTLWHSSAVHPIYIHIYIYPSYRICQSNHFYSVSPNHKSKSQSSDCW